MIPQDWKEKILNVSKLEEITCDILQQVKKNKKCCQYFYWKFISIFSLVPEKQPKKWEANLKTEDITWEIVYKLPFTCTFNNKLTTFQYKILHRILSTNSFLFKCKLKETNLCTFCNETNETIEHLFWECNITKNLWFEIADIFQNRCNITLPVSAHTIMLGADDLDLSTNYFIVLIKYFIYSCRLSGSKPTIVGLINMLRKTYNIEKLSVTFCKSPSVGERIRQKWAVIEDILWFKGGNPIN